MTDAGRASEWATFLDAIAQASGTCRARGDVAGQPRRQHRRPRRSGPARPAVQPGQAATASPHLVGDGGRTRPSRARGRCSGKPTGHAGTRRWRRTAMRSQRLGGAWRACAVQRALRGPVRRPVSDDPAAGSRRRPRDGHPELQCGDPLFLHQCARAGIRSTRRIASRRRSAIIRRARWIVALHHHVVEYPMPVKAFSERIGTALINGSWFERRLEALAGRAVVMHGHRHIDWIGAMRLVEDRLRALAGDERDRRCGDAVLYSYAGGRARWTAWSAAAAARGDCRREKRLGDAHKLGMGHPPREHHRECRTLLFGSNCAALHSASFVNHITHPTGDRM